MQAPLQELGWSLSAVLERQRFKAGDEIDAVDVSIVVHPADDQETAVEDTCRGCVPALLEEIEVDQVLENSATLPSG